MAVTIDGAGPITGLTSLASPTTLNGLTIPTTGFGKILQIVRATDSTDRTTTSTSFVDVTGMAVTITPTSATSNILLIFNFFHQVYGSSTDNTSKFQITDSSDVQQSGGYASSGVGNMAHTTAIVSTRLNMIAWASPGVTSAVTYKLRMKSAVGSHTTAVYNALSSSTGQMYAIEVAA